MARMVAGSRSRAALLVALLVSTLAMASGLAYEAVRSARSHRATAENVLREYARFAVWELSRLSRRQLFDAFNMKLGELHQRVHVGGLTAASAALSGGDTCARPPHLRTAFYAPGPSGMLQVAGEPLAAAERHIVEAAMEAAWRAPERHDCPMLIVFRDGEARRVVVWRLAGPAAGKALEGVGFVADAAFVGEQFVQLLRTTPLLPPSLVPTGRPNDLLTVRVSAPSAGDVFVAGQAWSEYEARQDLETDLAGLRLAVALRPDAAAALVIGGLPRDRLPLVLGLLALATVMVVVALVQLRREMELARLRSDFVSGVSHELRTPLAQIRMFSETLLLGRVRSDGEARRSIEIVAREAQRLTQLVENVLLFARGERRRARIAPQPARLLSIVSEVVETFAPLAAARHARLVTRVEERGEIIAEVDAGATRQILLNLLDNAVKYGPMGQTVTIGVALDGDRARLTVEDEGPGIEAHDAERIWQPFSRLARGEAAATGGAGIGLAIVRELAELHGGSAWVDGGRRGAAGTAGGSRFTVEFPRASRETPATNAVA